jgi:hypothetical protein
MGTKALILLLSAVMLVGCGASGKSTGEPPAARPGDAKESPEAATQKEESRLLELTPEQAARLGVGTSAMQAARYAGRAEGFGVVISHDLVAQAAADLHSTTAAAKLSEAALARAKGLAGGPGALGADAVENAMRQQTADQAAVQLARRKLTSLLGVAFPWPDGAGGELERLADGAHKLLRVTFPADSAVTGTPKTLRVSSIDATAGTGWSARTLWAAPQDPSLPGHSVFAVLTDATLAEGARVRAQAESDSAVTGVVVPEPAVVISDGASWCYVKRNDDQYQRVAIDTSRPLGEGYFVADGLAAGDEVVTTGAGLLLARELNASTGTDD